MQKPDIRYLLIGTGLILASAIFALLYDGSEEKPSTIGLGPVAPTIQGQPGESGVKCAGLSASANMSMRVACLGAQ
jgi:hypothetical protein